MIFVAPFLQTRRLLFLGLIIAALIVVGQASSVKADSWALPEQQVYLSADKTVRLTVTPRDLNSPLDYFQDKVKGSELAGQRKGGNAQARGRLERKDAAGAWIVVWEKPLVNEVSPVGAVVSNSGRYIVTFDNWHSVGYGDDAVVIYNSEGSLIRALSLTQILPENYVSALPRTTSSIHWGRNHSIIENAQQLNLKIVVPEKDSMRSSARYVDVFIDLATGRVETPSSSAWMEALALVDLRNAEVRNAEEAQRRYLTAPLLGPKVNNQSEWHNYLREGFARLTPDWQEDVSSTTVLRLPTANDYAPSRTWVKEALLDKYADDVSIASLSPANLIVVLKQTLSSVARDKLKNLEVYIAATDQYWPEIEAIFAKSGATLVQLNPEKPISQNPDRLKAMLEIRAGGE